MESPLQKLDRLLSAFDALSARETAMLAAAEWDGATMVQDRIQALADAIFLLAKDLGAAGPMPRGLRSRIGKLIQRQRASLDSYRSRMLAVQDELGRSNEARSRLTALRPAYSTTAWDPAARARSGGFFSQG